MDVLSAVVCCFLFRIVIRLIFTAASWFTGLAVKIPLSSVEYCDCLFDLILTVTMNTVVCCNIEAADY